MHIQEGTNTTLTTCTKMTEEVDRRHGVNGNSSKGVNDDVPVQNSSNATGGRLKFFKDGKFILELVRGSAREGERAGWVSVPRKTFWPPAAPHAPHHAHATVTPHTPRVERAASLSVSDDNSSIQSSPWQRDHCWKQTNPRRNISKELTMYYCRPSTLPSSAIEAGSRRKRRRPHDTHALRTPANGLRNGDAHDALDGPHYHMKLKKPHQYQRLRVYTKTRSGPRRGLSTAIDRLREKVAALPTPVNAKLVSCRQEHMMVSPRKRILRELERVSLEDQSMKRRAKTACPGAGPSRASPAPPPAAAPAPPASKHVSNYSIHSLLSMPETVASSSPSLSPSPPGYRRAPVSPFAVRARDEWPYVYGFAPYLPPRPPLYYYAVSPPGPWAPLAHPAALFAPHAPRDETASDLPLNLSKH